MQRLHFGLITRKIEFRPLVLQLREGASRVEQGETHTHMWEHETREKERERERERVNGLAYFVARHRERN